MDQKKLVAFVALEKEAGGIVDSGAVGPPRPPLMCNVSIIYPTTPPNLCLLPRQFYESMTPPSPPLSDLLPFRNGFILLFMQNGWINRRLEHLLFW